MVVVRTFRSVVAAVAVASVVVHTIVASLVQERVDVGHILVVVVLLELQTYLADYCTLVAPMVDGKEVLDHQRC